MIKKTITYLDYDGKEQTDTFYFNLNQTEFVEMEAGAKGGFLNMINKIVETREDDKIVAIFKDMILRSYGEISVDRKRFIKSAELANAFSQTEAYVKLFMELATDSKAAADFVNGIRPQGLAPESK